VTSGCVALSYDESNPDAPLCRLYATAVAGGINPYGGYTFYDQACWSVLEDCVGKRKREVGLSEDEIRRLVGV
jgi:hypothetical protein